jgi:Dihydrodipicolinate reductase, N-terminus
VASSGGSISSVASPVLDIGIHGATGRMGTRLIQLIQADPALRLAVALDRADHPRLGEDAGTAAGVGPLGVSLSSTFERPVDVMIDFSTQLAPRARSPWSSARPGSNPNSGASSNERRRRSPS